MAAGSQLTLLPEVWVGQVHNHSGDLAAGLHLHAGVPGSHPEAVTGDLQGALLPRA